MKIEMKRRWGQTETEEQIEIETQGDRETEATLQEIRIEILPQILN